MFAHCGIIGIRSDQSSGLSRAKQDCSQFSLACCLVKQTDLG
jgi:hypothetical protein